MSYLGVGQIPGMVSTAAVTSGAASSTVTSGASSKPTTPCRYAGGWQLYRGGPPWNLRPRWLCQETDPDKFPDPPGYRWKGGTGKRKPWHWEKIVESGTGPKRYYDKVIKDGVALRMFRYTPAGQIGPAGPGPRWYSDKARSDAGEAPKIVDASDSYYGRICTDAGVPAHLVPICVQGLREGHDIDEVVSTIEDAIARGELPATPVEPAPSSSSKVLVYGGLAAAGLAVALLLRRKK